MQIGGVSSVTAPSAGAQVNLSKKQGQQLEAVVNTILSGVDQTAQAIQGKGQRLNITA